VTGMRQRFHSDVVSVFVVDRVVLGQVFLRVLWFSTSALFLFVYCLGMGDGSTSICSLVSASGNVMNLLRY
jgi:hypothetical protein